MAQLSFQGHLLGKQAGVHLRAPERGGVQIAKMILDDFVGRQYGCLSLGILGSAG